MRTSWAARAAPLRRTRRALAGKAGELATDLSDPSSSVTTTWNSPWLSDSR